MLKSQNLKYYYWDDIEEFLSEKIGISVYNFNNYHHVIGGNYKGFWHVWMKLVDNDVENHHISTVYFDRILDEKRENEIQKSFGDWINPLFLALKELESEICKESFNVKYDWESCIRVMNF